ncbi:MBL fold metallo-hydrolase [bacterium]|nr:MBL fold metallo-hydrolase [bacterium]
MRTRHVFTLMTGLMLGWAVSAAVGAAGGDDKTCEKSKACPKAGKLLKGIVHLTDNDVRFQTKDKKTIFVDPMSGPGDSLVVSLGKMKPDLILITHPHGDHLNLDVLKAYVKVNPEVIVAGPADAVRVAKEKGFDSMRTVEMNKAAKLAGVEFETVPAYFTEGDHHPKASGWAGYVLRVNGNRYYVTGDTGPTEEAAKLKADVIFPLLWGCGGNAEGAVKLAAISNASLIVPVHHGGSKDALVKLSAMLPKGLCRAVYLNGKLTQMPE